VNADSHNCDGIPFVEVVDVRAYNHHGKSIPLGFAATLPGRRRLFHSLALKPSQSSMAKRPSPGKCVHCLADNVNRTWDHVFPRAWYPNTTPSDVYKWQIPSCHPCNRDYGTMEDDLLCRLALCVDPHVPETAGIVEKALRSIKSGLARDERDRNARAARARHIYNELLYGSEIPQSAIYPGLGERWGRPSAQGLGVCVPANSLRRLTEKIVRGIFFLEDNAFIEADHAIAFYALTDEGAEPIKNLLDRFGREYARKPGIAVRRAVADDQPTSAVFEIDVWGQFKLYSSVEPVEP
jgi:hypothetical protein